MDIEVSEKAESDLDSMDPNLRKIFLKHMEKIKEMPPRRHMRFGLPFFVEDVSRQSRLIYFIKDQTIFILRCFQSHKEYERWYLSFK